MKEKTMHTPIPWKSGGCVVYGADGEGVADLVAGICNHSRRSPDETEANTSLIVRAVNSHAQLLEALEGALYRRSQSGTAIPICRRCSLTVEIPHKGHTIRVPGNRFIHFHDAHAEDCWEQEKKARAAIQAAKETR